MSVEKRCQCGSLLRAPAGFAAGRAICPVCKQVVTFGEPMPKVEPPRPQPPTEKPFRDPLPVVEFLDPPPPVDSTPVPPGPPWSQRMIAAMLDPRSIQWMLMLGGGLMVLGLIIWLVSLGIFENTLIVAATLTIGSLLVHLAGCGVFLKTRHKIAGQALTFLGCVLLPLNLWFYHYHGLMSLEGNLWVGGVVCCALYVATVIVLRDPLFLYAVEAGVTLTLVLLLGSQGMVTDVAWLSVVLMILGVLSIHLERAFPPQAETFDRPRYGLPLFWSGHVQMAAALLTLLGSQLGTLLFHPQVLLFGFEWGGNHLTESYWLAGGLWLAGAYAYVYSDLVVRRAGYYIYLAAVCLVAAEITIIGNRLPGEALIAVPAVTGLLLALFSLRPTTPEDRLGRNLMPLALVLSGLSVVIGATQHIRATSELIEKMGGQVTTGWAFVGTMLLVVACTRIVAALLQEKSTRLASAYLFLSAASVLVAAAGVLRCMDITTWTFQAPLLMIVPLGYLAAVWLWRGRQPEEPLGIAAHVGAAVILLHVLFSTIKEARMFLVPLQDAPENLWIGVVFAEATIFYFLASVLRRHEANIYAATAAACGALWQWAGFFGVPGTYYTVLFAVLGLGLLAVARAAGFSHVKTFKLGGGESSAIVGRGTAMVHSASALLTLGFLSGLLHGLSRLVTRQADWPLLTALLVTAGACLAAAAIAPHPTWRRLYVTWAIGLAGLAFITLNVLINLTVWQKAEIFSVVVGVAMLVAGFVGRFLEKEREEHDGVSLCLLFGSLLATAALLIAVFYHRFAGDGPSLPDEIALVLLTVAMLVTGYSWQLRAPTLLGGLSLTVYLLVLIGMLAYFPNVAMGVYLAVGGGLLFACGIALSVFRERLLELPEKVSRREGVFQVLTWR